jgi:hypothetical protein
MESEEYKSEKSSLEQKKLIGEVIYDWTVCLTNP